VHSCDSGSSRAVLLAQEFQGPPQEEELSFNKDWCWGLKKDSKELLLPLPLRRRGKFQGRNLVLVLASQLPLPGFSREKPGRLWCR